MHTCNLELLLEVYIHVDKLEFLLEVMMKAMAMKHICVHSQEI